MAGPAQHIGRSGGDAGQPGRSVDAVRAALPQIEEAAAALHARLAASQTGRLVYTGAGTSARIGVQDGAELLPTFDWPDSRTAFVIAGGPAALLQPVEMPKMMKRRPQKLWLIWGWGQRIA